MEIFIHVQAPISMNTRTQTLLLYATSEKLDQLNLEIYEVRNKKCLTVDGDVTYH
jgi:hypothetical protein